MATKVSSGRALASVVACAVALTIVPAGLMEARPFAMAALGGQSQPPQQPQPQQPAAKLTPQQLQGLVAPIALYPDALVAQILAASAYPTEIVEADRFLQENPNLQGKDLADAVDQQDWDPSVKALTQFPSVLANMDKDLAWTSELGDANYNQPQDVMDAIQFMRQQAQQAGRLNTTPQQTVTNQNSTIAIEPANPQIVYVPEYDPELIYGYPVPLWPGFYPWWVVTGPFISFGVGFDIFPFFGFAWGWPAWGCHWGFGGGLVFGGRPYVFQSHAFYDRNAYFHGNFQGHAPFGRGDRSLRGYATPEGRAVAPGGRPAPSAGFRGRPAPSVQPSTRPASPSVSSGRVGAFGGITRGGDARTFESRGQASMGGGMRGGGGRR